MSIAEKLATIASNVQKVYEAGIAVGRAEQGGQGDYDYDTFWDGFQGNGGRTNYNYAFYYWTDAMFRPKYDIAPTINGAQDMFHYSSITDLASLLTTQDRVLDFTNAASLYNTFAYSSITSLPPINLSSCTNMTLAFRNATSITAITLNNLRDDCLFDRTFNVCSGLVDLMIDGTIGKVKDSNNGFYLKDSPNLTAASVKSVIDALRDAGPLEGSKVMFAASALERAKAEYTSLANDITTLNSKGWAISGS